MNNTKTTAPQLLDRAAGHMRDRAATYDKPEGERSMAQTVAIFNLYHGTALTEAQGWHFQQVLKDVRLFTRPEYHADSAEDCIAYSALKAEAMANGAALAVSAVTAEPDDGWIEWGGGNSSPVDRGTVVHVRYRCGERNCDDEESFRWKHSSEKATLDPDYDIIAYRVVPSGN